jgi:photosystem II stability/assembly factor-like uncharacterized protein
MDKDFEVESRLRRYAQAFRREANPRLDLAGRLMAGVRQGTPRPQSRFGVVPAFAMAGGVVLVGIVIAFGAWQLRTLGHKSPTPPISVTTPTPTATAESTPTPSPSATSTPTPTPSAAPSGVVPAGIPGLASIQMVGSRLGWAVGSHAIYATTDGTHWTKQYASSEDFVGVDFISTTTGWVVGGQTLLGTTDGGRSWHQLGEARQLIRSVHFINTNQGWGISGGNELVMHGVLIPGSGGTIVVSNDGGHSWVDLNSPADPQSVCFSDAAHGWLATQSGTVYRSQNGGQTWSQSLQMARSQPGLSGWARVECAAPSALWVQWAPGGGAAGHSPYVVYATTNGQTWRTVMAEPGTIGNELPGVPAGPGSYPGSFSVVDPSDAVFVGDTPAANSQRTMIATNGGTTLKSTGEIVGPWQTFDAAFVSTSTGWVLTVDSNGHDIIVATADGGYHWAQQLAVAQ